MRWVVRLVRGRQYLSKAEVGDILDFEAERLTIPDCLSKREIAERAFAAGRKVGPPISAKMTLVPFVGDVD